ncbi:MAG: 1-acyl-sn-glycerol-3-phosphate acyltransferase [Prevotellaceae bacterium]|nr:1-acyl-sn-glycerol-3-phosphate acyltransferase [Candidatus Colivivens equi]
MHDIHYFDDIRPYLPEELPQAFDTLLADQKFINVIKAVMPEITLDQLSTIMHSCKTNLEFQQKLVYQFVMKIAQNATTGLDADFSALDFNTGYTFISNHRDIVLDSAFLCALLIDHKQDTVEIAIGDNLLIHPWIRNLVRINRSFIVQRQLTMRQMLLASKKMSEYINHVITNKHSNVWIAQREGRAKDSNDRTQDSVLKMLCLGGNSQSVIDNLKQLNIVPLAISYEFDPCDYLKAWEFQNKRDIPSFKKSQQDDLDNMRTGILGYKGQVHYHAAPCINDWLDTLNPNTPKAELFDIIAKYIDTQIHSHYRLYPINEEALQCLNSSDNSKLTTSHEYIESQIKKISIHNPDYEYLKEKIITMYANPARNYYNAIAGLQ